MCVCINGVCKSSIDVLFGIVQKLSNVVRDEVGTAVIVSWGPVWVGDYE